MTESHPDKLKSLFHAALREPAEDRQAFIDRACQNEPGLRAELEALLAADARADDVGDEVAAAARELLAARGEPDIEGRRIGAYRIVREIGRGGMGRVCMAERDDDQYASRVAIKLLESARGRGSQERFRTECQLLADLEHPGIARLLDAGISDDGEPYLVMEYVDGQPIDGYCEAANLSVEQRLRLFIRLCDAVEHAHRNLIVHRDIKASNVLVTADGEPKLLDFGIAKLLDTDRARSLDLHLTMDANRLLTPASASPEQLRGEPVTTATDVYALGYLLFRLLTGTGPYGSAAEDRFTLPEAIVSREPLRASAAVRSAPQSDANRNRLARRLAGDLDAILLKALRKQPDQRYATPRQLADDIERHLEHRPVAARGDALGYIARRFFARYRLPFAVAATVLVVVIGLVTFYTAQLTIERDRARTEARRAEEVAAFLSELFEIATPEQSRGAEVTAREMLDRGAARIGSELAGEPLVQAQMMRVIGSAYGSLGLYDAATEMLERALATGEGIGDADDGVLGDALQALGTVLVAQARYPEARAVLERALVLRGTRAASDPGALAATHRAMSEVEFSVADFEAAASHLDQAESAIRTVDPLDEAGLADILLARGTLRKRLGEYDAAIEIEREAIELRTRASGPDHPATLEARDALADALNDAGRMDEARDVLSDLLDIRRRVLPAGHPDIARSLTNLASSFKLQGRPEEALPLQAEALALLQAAHDGGDHPDIATALNNLANLRHDVRDLDAAVSLHEESLAMNTRLFGEDHPSLADSYNNLGTVLMDREDYTGALLMFRRTLALDASGLGEDHPYVSQDRQAIGVALGLLDRLDEAEAWIREALDGMRASLGADHPQTLNAMRELGIIRRRQGECVEAIELLGAALPGLERAFPGEPWQVATARVNLGACRAESDAEEGERLMRRGYERLEIVQGSDGRLTRDARELLASFLRARGRIDEARALGAPLD